MESSSLQKAFSAALHPRTKGGLFADKLAANVSEYMSLHSGDPGIDKAVAKYADGHNARLNGYLRSEGHGDPELDDMVAKIDHAFENLGTPASPVLYRGVDLGNAPHLQHAIAHGGFHDESFTSTTGNLQIARNFATRHMAPKDPAVLAIHVPKDTKTLKYNQLNEGEEILPRGGKFVTKGVTPETRAGHTVKRVEMEWVPR